MLRIYRKGEFSKLKKGPWSSEPDTIEWVFKNTLCAIIRNNLGSLCGYACVYPGHPGYGKNYNDVDYSAHGGLTFSDSSIGRDNRPHHMNNGGDVWYFGFDCAHAGDFIPYASSWVQNFSYQNYRDVGYVLAETEQLASQLMLEKCDCGHLYQDHVFGICSKGCNCIDFRKTQEIISI